MNQGNIPLPQVLWTIWSTSRESLYESGTSFQMRRPQDFKTKMELLKDANLRPNG